jgi:probable F420-dependent oxidoreductase
MDIGLGIPQIGRFADPAQTRTVAVMAEEAGYSSLWALDRVLAPLRPRTAYPASADGALPLEQYTALDPLITLTLAAAMTDRIRIGTNVLVAPWYPPVLLARSLASLDQVSDGRLTVGLGLGWSADEYAAVGVPQRELALRIEEVLEVLAVAWREDVVEIETSRELVAPSIVGLKPVQSPRPPILLAAYTPAGLERIARRADGWTPAGMPVEVLGPMWASVLDQAARYGRDPRQLRLVVRANVHRTDSPVASDRPPFVGSLDQLRGDVEQHRELGVDELILDLQGTTSSVDELLDLAASMTADVMAER